MADVFVSYTGEDRDRVQRLADVLGAQGWTVWWDRDIPIGKSFQEIIAGALDSARSVCVVWSRRSVASNWVLEEADEGKRRSILYPVRIDDVALPLGFRSIQCADLNGWQGDAAHPGLAALLAALGSHLGGPRELKIEEAVRLIQKFCALRKIQITAIAAGQSSTATKYFAGDRGDGMGAVYCHASGPRLGEVYYVRQGIGLYYHHHVGGPKSALGLPISNEELVDATGFPTTFFEGGYIDWSPRTAVARAMIFTPEGERTMGTPAVV